MRFATLRSSSRLTRLAATAALSASLFGGVMAQAPAAHADFSWCWDDPVVSINGHTLTTQVGAAISSTATGSNDGVSKALVVYTLPANVSATVLSQSSTVNFHEQVKFQSSGQAWTPGTPLVVGVTVTWNYTQNLPTNLTNAVDGGAATATPGTTASGNATAVTIQLQ